MAAPHSASVATSNGSDAIACSSFIRSTNGPMGPRIMMSAPTPSSRIRESCKARVSSSGSRLISKIISWATFSRMESRCTKSSTCAAWRASTSRSLQQAVRKTVRMSAGRHLFMAKRCPVKPGIHIYPNRAFTAAEMARPSAVPARRLEATPITLPMSRMEVAPTSAMISLTRASSSSGESCFGR